jgi:hypothetical protein
MFIDFNLVNYVYSGDAVSSFNWDFGCFREESIIVVYGAKLVSFEGDGVFYTQLWAGDHISAMGDSYDTSIYKETAIFTFATAKKQRKFITKLILGGNL